MLYLFRNVIWLFQIKESVENMEKTGSDNRQKKPLAIIISASVLVLVIAAGYFLVGFDTAGETINGTLHLNQTQLCVYDITEIVGDTTYTYSALDYVKACLSSTKINDEMKASPKPPTATARRRTPTSAVKQEPVRLFRNNFR